MSSGPTAAAPPVLPAPEAPPTRTEMMVVAAAREVRDGDRVFVGIGLPNLAVRLAQRLHAARSNLLYESGVFGARPARTPLSIGDPCLVSGAAQVLPMTETFLFFLQGGRCDLGLLGAAQIDRFGNLNTTVIGGDYARPSVRLPGAGGAPDIAWNARRTVVVLRQDARKFVERLDFRTTVGWAEGGDSRERLGAPGGGPVRVVTDLGVYGFHPKTREMVLESVHPGVSVERAREAVSWDLQVSEAVGPTPPPAPETLRLLREELDPDGAYLGKR